MSLMEWIMDIGFLRIANHQAKMLGAELMGVLQTSSGRVCFWAWLPEQQVLVQLPLFLG